MSLLKLANRTEIKIYSQSTTSKDVHACYEPTELNRASRVGVFRPKQNSNIPGHFESSNSNLGKKKKQNKTKQIFRKEFTILMAVSNFQAV